MAGVTQEQLNDIVGQKPGGVYAWDDLSGNLMGSRFAVARGHVDYDLFNAGLSFDDSSEYPGDPCVIPVQYLHKFVVGADAIFRPHFHWLQRQAEVPNMCLAYKISRNGHGTTFESDFTNYTLAKWSAHVWDYATEGHSCLVQITRFPNIDITSLDVSDMIDMVLFRDHDNSSTLFTGADPVTGDVTIKYTDGHALIDQPGSLGEISKAG